MKYIVLALLSLFISTAPLAVKADPSDFEVSPSNGTATFSGTISPSGSNTSGSDTGNLWEKVKEDASDLENSYEDKVNGFKEKVDDKFDVRTPSAVTSVRG